MALNRMFSSATLASQVSARYLRIGRRRNWVSCFVGAETQLPQRLFQKKENIRFLGERNQRLLLIIYARKICSDSAARCLCGVSIMQLGAFGLGTRCRCYNRRRRRLRWLGKLLRMMDLNQYAQWQPNQACRLICLRISLSPFRHWPSDAPSSRTSPGHGQAGRPACGSGADDCPAGKNAAPRSSPPPSPEKSRANPPGIG